MLKSSNLESIIGAVETEGRMQHAADTAELPSPNNNNSNNSATVITTTTVPATPSTSSTCPQTDVCNNNDNNDNEDALAEAQPTLPSMQLTAGLLQMFEPPLVKARGQLKELIGKQNKIYIDLSAEKFKLDNAEIAKLHDMMNNVKIYREKLIKIKKQMQHIYQRTKVLKKRAANVQTSKQKELQRKLHKQQHEESLIAKQQQQQQQQQSPQ